MAIKEAWEANSELFITSDMKFTVSFSADISVPVSGKITATIPAEITLKTHHKSRNFDIYLNTDYNFCTWLALLFNIEQFFPLFFNLWNTLD